MNENNKLADFLRNLPEGATLYTPLYGYMQVWDINDSGINLTAYCKEDDDHFYLLFRDDGCMANFEKGECLLFPTRLCRDWNMLYFEPNDIIAMDITYKTSNKVTYVLDFCSLEYKSLFAVNTYACLCKKNEVLTFGTSLDLYGTSIEETNIFLRYATDKEEDLFADAIRKSGRHWDEDKQRYVLSDENGITFEQLRQDYDFLRNEYKRLEKQCIQLQTERDEVKTHVAECESQKNELFGQMYRFENSEFVECGVACTHRGFVSGGNPVIVGFGLCMSCRHLIKADVFGKKYVLCAVRYDNSMDLEAQENKNTDE